MVEVKEYYLPNYTLPTLDLRIILLAPHGVLLVFNSMTLNEES